MKFFISINKHAGILDITVNPTKPIGLLIKQLKPKVIASKDYEEDNEIYLKNSQDAFDKGKSPKDLGLANKDHLFVGKCSKATISVNYMGSVISDDFPVAFGIKRILKWSVEEFNIDAHERPKLVLRDADNQIIDKGQLVGSLVEYPDCSVQIFLTSKRDIQG